MSMHHDHPIELSAITQQQLKNVLSFLSRKLGCDRGPSRSYTIAVTPTHEDSFFAVLELAGAVAEEAPSAFLTQGMYRYSRLPSGATGLHRYIDSPQTTYLYYRGGVTPTLMLYRPSVPGKLNAQHREALLQQVQQVMLLEESTRPLKMTALSRLSFLSSPEDITYALALAQRQRHLPAGLILLGKENEPTALETIDFEVPQL